MQPLEDPRPPEYISHCSPPMDLVDDGAESYIQACSACSRSFRGPGAFQNHLRGCKSTKKRMCKTLVAAKDIIARKRWRRDEIATTSRNAIELSGDVINVSCIQHSL